MGSLPDIPNKFWKTFHVARHARGSWVQRQKGFGPKKCSGFRMSRTTKIWSRRHFTAKTNRQEGGSERLTEARGGPRKQRKMEGLDWSRAAIKSQVDLQPVCLLLLLLLLAPSYQQAEGSTPRPPTPPRQHSSPAPPALLIVPSLMCPVCRNARGPVLCHAPRGASRLAAPP